MSSGGGDLWANKSFPGGLRINTLVGEQVVNIGDLGDPEPAFDRGQFEIDFVQRHRSSLERPFPCHSRSNFPQFKLVPL